MEYFGTQQLNIIRRGCSTCPGSGLCACGLIVSGFKILGHNTNPTRIGLKSFHGLRQLTLELRHLASHRLFRQKIVEPDPSGQTLCSFFKKKCATLYTYRSVTYWRTNMTFISEFSFTTEPTAERAVQFDKQWPTKHTLNMVNWTIILPVVLYGCETWLLTLREERRLRVFENKVLRRIFGPRRDEVTGEWRRLHNEELNDLYTSPNIVRVI